MLERATEGGRKLHCTHSSAAHERERENVRLEKSVCVCVCARMKANGQTCNLLSLLFKFATTGAHRKSARTHTHSLWHSFAFSTLLFQSRRLRSGPKLGSLWAGSRAHRLAGPLTHTGRQAACSGLRAAGCQAQIRTQSSARPFVLWFVISRQSTGNLSLSPVVRSLACLFVHSFVRSLSCVCVCL